MPTHTPPLSSNSVSHKDTLKHAETLVQELQQRLSDREADLIARMGGDEFVILLTGKPGERDELLVKNRLEENLASLNKKQKMAFPLMFSIGFSRYNHGSPCSIEDLLSQADTLMFREKRKKKDQSNKRGKMPG